MNTPSPLNPSDSFRNFTSRPDLPAITENTRVFFLRHPQPSPEYSGKIYGQMDAPLSEEGQRVADKFVYRLRSLTFRIVYTSDLSRALYLSDSLVRLFGAGRCKEPRLRERHYGEWQGLRWKDLDPMALAAYEADKTMAPPGGESFQDVAARSLPVVDEIVRRHIGEEVAVVAHSNVIRAVVSDALGIPPSKAFSFQLKHCSVTAIDYRDALARGRHNPYVAILNG
jgi:alpha-ribazole phosphatase